MREINVKEIEENVRNLCIQANIVLPYSLENAVKSAYFEEISPVGKKVLQDLHRNINVALEENIPVCQDTGMAIVFLEIGQDVHLVGGNLKKFVNIGVARGYLDADLRCSTVSEPLFSRENTGNNTPAILYTKIVDGEQVKVTVAPKGFGSENMSKIRMFNPSASYDEICQFIVSVVSDAGSNPCPPVIVGVGVGGDFEYCAFLAKKALCREISIRNENDNYKKMEADLLERINKLGIGPQGFGGKITALAVNVEFEGTHIAGLPVAVNMGCHVTRHWTRMI